MAITLRQFVIGFIILTNFVLIFYRFLALKALWVSKAIGSPFVQLCDLIRPLEPPVKALDLSCSIPGPGGNRPPAQKKIIYQINII